MLNVIIASAIFIVAWFLPALVGFGPMLAIHDDRKALRWGHLGATIGGTFSVFLLWLTYEKWDNVAFVFVTLLVYGCSNAVVLHYHLQIAAMRRQALVHDRLDVQLRLIEIEALRLESTLLRSPSSEGRQLRLF